MVTRIGGPLTALSSFVCAVVGLLLALIGLVSVASPKATAVAPHMTYAYDSQHHSSVLTEATNERGPPGWVADITAHAAADSAPRGASARPDGMAHRAFVYDHPTLLVQLASVAPPAEVRRATDTAAPRAPGRLCVAANAVPPRFITTGAGTTIDRLAVNTTISAQRQGRHVLGARQYGGGSYFNSADDAQGVLDAFHSGGAQVLGAKGNDIVVRVPGITGFNHNPGAGFPNQATNVFFIKGSSSPSVVPYNPAWKP